MCMCLCIHMCTADAFSFIRSYFALSFPSELSRLIAIVTVLSSEIPTLWGASGQCGMPPFLQIT